MPASSPELVTMLLRRARRMLVPEQLPARTFDDVVSKVRPRLEAHFRPLLAALPWGGFVRKEEQAQWQGMKVQHRPDGRMGTVAELDRGGFRARVAFEGTSKPQLVRGRDLELVADVTTSKKNPTSFKARMDANLAALRVLASHPPPFSPQEKQALRQFTGFGGLSIKKILDQWPTGIPRPSARALEDEFYTPEVLADAVAELVRARLDGIRDEVGQVRALEPAAGIGRLMFQDPSVRWTAVEYSAVSAQILEALRPDVDVRSMPFERFIRDNSSEFFQTLGLVVSNPPYSNERGDSAADDPDRSTRKLNAAQYFVLRASELLRPGGLGVFIVQHTLMSGKNSRAWRQHLLRRAHLAAAFRLPSDLFPGALLVVDVLVLRARGGMLAADSPDDQYIIDGKYFEQHPEHVLGTEETTPGTRRGYQVSGTFSGFPTFVEREPCACAIMPLPRAWLRTAFQARILEDKQATEVLKARSLGVRVAEFGRRAASGEDLGTGPWRAIASELQEWANEFGNPWEHPDIRELAASDADVGRFAALFNRNGSLTGEWLSPPRSTPQGAPPADFLEVVERLWARNAVVPLATAVDAFRGAGLGELQLDQAALELEAGQWAIDFDNVGVPTAVMPLRHYLTGDLWRRLDNALLVVGPLRGLAQRQIARLRAAIDPLPFEALPEPSPKFAWLPLDLVNAFANDLLRSEGAATWTLELREDGYIGWKGLTDKKGNEVKDIKVDRDHLPSLFIGWLNDDMGIFSPDAKLAEDFGVDPEPFQVAAMYRQLGKPPPPPPPPWEAGLPSLTQAIRDAMTRAWSREFRVWLDRSEERRSFYANAWNRHFRGWTLPEYPRETPLPVGWSRDIRPHWWQVQGALRFIDQRAGLVAYDVGLGKTLTAILMLALGKERGMFRRPVIVVPNTVTWQWVAEIARAVPHFRVGVVGSKLVEDDNGNVSDLNDTPEERAQKWLAFQRGVYDVMVVTATAFPRAQVDITPLEPMYREMRDFMRAAEEDRERLTALKKKLEKQASEGLAALASEDDFEEDDRGDEEEDDEDEDDDDDDDDDRKKKKKKKKEKWTTERLEARLALGFAGFLKELNELPPKQRPDPGVVWNDLGVDCLIVDEAQRYKGLFTPPTIDNTVPKFMGAGQEGSRRAWHLHARAAAVRQKNGDTGVFLLSATPAKNSPLELYNALSYVSSSTFLDRGITTHIAFCLRYCQFAMAQVVSTTLKKAGKMCLVGFQNLDELRAILFRFAAFYNAEQVGLPLPEPLVRPITVAMTLRQEAAMAVEKKRLETALKSRKKGEVFSAMAAMSLIGIHPDLVDRTADGEAAWDWKNAKDNPDPGSAKFERCAQQVVANTTCNHLIFCQNLAAQWWLREVLVAAGIPRDQIAVMNAKTAPRPAARRQMALAFTGSDPGPLGDSEILPTKRVLIANEVAYEGANLQRVTCAIHHIDIPWEPATLQQRNGRAVRQGNKLDVVAIYTYLAPGSGDALRLQQISGKLNWMETLIQGTARDTNNPAAQQETTGFAMAEFYAGDENRLEAFQAELEAEQAREGLAKFVRGLGRNINLVRGRLDDARHADPVEAGRLRQSARENWARILATAPAGLLPFLERASRVVFSRPVRVVGALPIWPGLALRLPDGELVELGKSNDATLVVRRVGTAEYEEKPLDILDAWSVEIVDEKTPVLRLPVEVDDFDVRLEEPELPAVLKSTARKKLEVGGDWRLLGLRDASPDFRQKAWDVLGDFVVGRVRAFRGPRIPVVNNGVLFLATGEELDGAVVLPWTQRGLERALATPLAPNARTTELGELAAEWWGQPFRRTREPGPVRPDEPHPILETAMARLRDAGLGIEVKDGRILVRHDGVPVGQVFFSERLRWEPATPSTTAEAVQLRGVELLKRELEKCCDLQP